MKKVNLIIVRVSLVACSLLFLEEAIVHNEIMNGWLAAVLFIICLRMEQDNSNFWRKNADGWRDLCFRQRDHIDKSGQIVDKAIERLTETNNEGEEWKSKE